MSLSRDSETYLSLSLSLFFPKGAFIYFAKVTMRKGGEGNLPFVGDHNGHAGPGQSQDSGALYGSLT